MFFQLEPWGSEIEWSRTGTIAAMIGNTAANRKANAKALSPKDFVPQFQLRQAGRKPNTKALRANFLGTFAGRIKHAKKDV